MSAVFSGVYAVFSIDAFRLSRRLFLITALTTEYWLEFEDITSVLLAATGRVSQMIFRPRLLPSSHTFLSLSSETEPPSVCLGDQG